MSVRLDSAPLLPLAASFGFGIVIASWLTPSPLVVGATTGGLIVLAGVALVIGHGRGVDH